MIEQQFEKLKELRARDNLTPPTMEQLPTGGFLIIVPDVRLCTGWNRDTATVLFIAPPGYPAARPDCFWVEPSGLRLAGEGTPQNTNDSNPIPGDNKADRRTTWFSWHLQGWDPNRQSLRSYFEVILQRLSPAR